MKKAFSAAFLYLCLLAVLPAYTLIESTLPSQRVRDEHQFLSAASRVMLEDFLENAARIDGLQIYVVLLRDQNLEEAVKLCDRWQAEWLPKGEGAVFVYSVKDKKFCFTPADATMKLVGEEQLKNMFRDAVETPPLRESLEVVISLPVFRLVMEIQKARLGVMQSGWDEEKQQARANASQGTRWKIVAAAAAGLALIAGLGCFFLLSRMALMEPARRGTGNIPPPGMAYRNPPRRSRSGRKRSRGEEGGGPQGGGESERRDRY